MWVSECECECECEYLYLCFLLFIPSFKLLYAECLCTFVSHRSHVRTERQLKANKTIIVIMQQREKKKQQNNNKKNGWRINKQQRQRLNWNRERWESEGEGESEEKNTSQRHRLDEIWYMEEELIMMKYNRGWVFIYPNWCVLKTFHFYSTHSHTHVNTNTHANGIGITRSYRARSRTELKSLAVIAIAFVAATILAWILMPHDYICTQHAHIHIQSKRFADIKFIQ